MALRSSKRLRNVQPDIVDTRYECFFCQSGGFTCDNNVIFLNCCKHFVHKTCQEKWISGDNGNHCGHCRQRLFDEDHEDGNESEEEEYDRPVSPPAALLRPDHPLRRLRSLIGNSEDIEQHLDWRNAGSSLTFGQFFYILDTTEFQRRMNMLCYELESSIVEKMILVVQYRTLGISPFTLQNLSRFLGPFVRALRALLLVQSDGRSEVGFEFENHVTLFLSTQGHELISYEISTGGISIHNSVKTWPTLFVSNFRLT